MALLEKQAKNVTFLTLEDFKQYPVWTWYETLYDESLVAPVKLTHPLQDEFANVFFILVTVILHDDTVLHGTIGFNLSNNSVFYLSFFKNGDEFRFDGSKTPGIGTLEKLSEWLGKPEDGITPLQYESPFVLEDGTHITGELDLHSW